MEVTTYPLFDHPPYTLALATKMGEVAEQAQLDLLHVHYAIPHSVSALLARMMAAPRRLPFITTLHGTDITLVGSDRSYLPITRFSIEQSDGVTAISHYLRDRTLKEFEIKRPIDVIPNFVNCDLYKKSDDAAARARWAPGGEPILMHLSNFRPVKRMTDVVAIFALVREKIAAKLVMIGDGPDRGAAEYIVRKKRLTKDVLFLGKQDRVHEKLGLADLFLLPSDEESFGLAALEAMACEVPVVATNVGGLPEVVKHGVDGYLFEPRDVDTAAKYALEILTRPDRGRDDGTDGPRQRAPPILLERYYSALRGLLRKGPELGGQFRSRVKRGAVYDLAGAWWGRFQVNLRTINSCRTFPAAVAPIPIAAFSKVNPTPRLFSG